MSATACVARYGLERKRHRIEARWSMSYGLELEFADNGERFSRARMKVKRLLRKTSGEYPVKTGRHARARLERAPQTPPIHREGHPHGAEKPPRRRVGMALADLERGLEDTDRRGTPSDVPVSK
jgi:hypothetical protein